MIISKTDMVLEEYGAEGLKLIYSDYEKDFPSNERKSFLRLSELLSFGEYRLIIARESANNKIKAYALALTLFKHRAVWVDYFAVSKSCRGKGLGSLFLSALKEYWKERADMLFAEVEYASAADPKERKAQEARICFYKSHSAVPIDINYEMPTNEGGFPLCLYYIPVVKGAAPNIDRVKLVTAYLFKYVHKDIKNVAEVYFKIFGEKLV